jgi:hypothetical protein
MKGSPPLVILACQVFQGWLERFLPEEARQRITFFDYGLHAVPKKLRQTLQETTRQHYRTQPGPARIRTVRQWVG